MYKSVQICFRFFSLPFEKESSRVYQRRIYPVEPGVKIKSVVWTCICTGKSVWRRTSEWHSTIVSRIWGYANNISRNFFSEIRRLKANSKFIRNGSFYMIFHHKTLRIQLTMGQRKWIIPILMEFTLSACSHFSLHRLLKPMNWIL